MSRVMSLLAVILATWAGSSSRAAYVAARIPTPAPVREFRGLWIATVNNIDWPSQPGLSTEQQQTELRALLDQAVRLKLNTVLFQVRPSADAFYASKLEPWSEYLTGRMGQAPAPFYDPLAFAIDEAHRRGLELHAWFNPFRARHGAAKSPVARLHVSRSQDASVKKYGGQLWLDPGEPSVREHSLRVILDVVKRYPVDGVHLDDYFYPYPEQDAQHRVLEFPDSASWRHYTQGGGKLSRDDWRRQNVDSFIQRLYESVKAARREVKVGLSPFGIWRPGHPPQIRGFDAYARLYADARKWLQAGWTDYLVPQLYWAIDAKEQSFPVLLAWWAAQNTHNRPLVPGMSCYRHSPAELVNQIRATRRQDGAAGDCLWGARLLLADRNGIATRFQSEVYAQPALGPAYRWLDSTPPAAPRAEVPSPSGRTVTLRWDPAGTEPVWLWWVQTKVGAAWSNSLLPGRETRKVLSGAPEVIAISAVDRCGNVSPPTVFERR